MTEPRTPCALFGALLLSACTVGPDVRPPQFDASPELAQFDPAMVSRDPLPGNVWAAYGEPEITSLIGRGLANNRGLAQLVARLNESRALRGLEAYSLFPTATVIGSAERSVASANDPFVPPDLGVSEVYELGFDARWELDLFGALKREREALNLRVMADTAAYSAARIALAAEIAQTWFAWRGAQARLALANQTIANLRESVEILKLQVDTGRGTALDLAQSRALGLGIAASQPGLEAEVERQLQRLALLTAVPAAELRRELAEQRSLPSLPTVVALGEPSDWLRRRPDLREAEARLAEAVARIGVETANLYPRLTLTGSFGGTAQAAGDVFDGDSERWRIGPSWSWQILDYGRVRQLIRASEARAEGALAVFEERVLIAIDELESALAAYRGARRTIDALTLALAEAQEVERLAQVRFDAGASGQRDVLDAQRSRIDFEDRRVVAEIQQATALAALHKALAGEFVK